MLHVIDNSLATSGGFTGNSVGFGIKCKSKPARPWIERPQPKRYRRHDGQIQRGRRHRRQAAQLALLLLLTPLRLYQNVP